MTQFMSGWLTVEMISPLRILTAQVWWETIKLEIYDKWYPKIVMHKVLFIMISTYRHTTWMLPCLMFVKTLKPYHTVCFFKKVTVMIIHHTMLKQNLISYFKNIHQRWETIMHEIFMSICDCHSCFGRKRPLFFFKIFVFLHINISDL